MERSENNINVLNLLAAIFIWAITSVWIYIIFMLSSETGPESLSRSFAILRIIKEAVGVSLSQTFIRKAALVVEYGFLSFAIYMGLSFTNGISEKFSISYPPRKRIRHVNELNIVYTFWLSSFIAALDEYVQLFIEGRDALIIDFFIDAASIIVMLLLIRIAFLIKLMILKQSEVEI